MLSEEVIAHHAAQSGAVKVKPDRETFDAMCAMRNSINEHIPMPSLESDLLQGPENSVFCATVAEAVIAEVARLRDMANGTKVKQLEWHNFDVWTYWAEGACGTYHVEERNGYWKVELRVGGLVHGVTETGDMTPEDLEAAKAAAQTDYEARILAALEPNHTHHAERAELARQNAALRAQVASLTADNEALQRMVANKGHDDRCLIWSHEHGCWWRPDSCGYTSDAKAAGVYSRAEAMLISHRGRDGWRDGCKPDELPVRLSDLPNWARDALANPAAKPGGAA